MELSKRPIVAVLVVAFALVVHTSTSLQAQQPEPLRLSSPPAHTIANLEPAAQAQVPAPTQTAQGELLDVDAKANTLTVKAQTREMTFRFNDQTKVKGAQRGVSGLATMTGSEVTVMFRKDGQTNLATTVDVKAEK